MICFGKRNVSFYALLTTLLIFSAALVEAGRPSGVLRDMAYRIRNPLLRTVVNRVYSDEEEKARDHSNWYKVNLNHFPELLCDKYVACNEDEETKEFLKNCFEKGDAVLTQMYHTVAKSFLTWFISSTSANGLLRRGSMFVFSRAHLKKLLAHPEGWQGNSLLDLGAGDGKVTKQMAPLFRDVYATEMSTTMNWRLTELGYKSLGIEEWHDGKRQYDLISCLNLLDRCDKPMSLLRQIRKSLTPRTGRAIVAVVIPYSPYIEYSSDHKPSEMVTISGKTFEEQVGNLVRHMFEPAGFVVERFTRLPYLCEGDLERSFYVLDDAVFVLKPS